MLLILSSLPPYLVIPAAISIFLAVLLGMTVHEFAHNYVGHLMGDPTPSRSGRLTLNPAVHINLPGFLMFVIIGFGTLGSAPISAYRMRNPRWGFLAAVAAGPLSNLLLAIPFALLFRVLGGNLNDTLVFMLYLFVRFNVLLFVFNLLPLFPLDGWHIVYALLPPDLAETWQRHAMTTQYIFFGMLLLSFIPALPFSPFSVLIGQPIELILRLLLGW